MCCECIIIMWFKGLPLTFARAYTASCMSLGVLESVRCLTVSQKIQATSQHTQTRARAHQTQTGRYFCLYFWNNFKCLKLCMCAGWWLIVSASSQPSCLRYSSLMCSWNEKLQKINIKSTDIIGCRKRYPGIAFVCVFIYFLYYLCNWINNNGIQCLPSILVNRNIHVHTNVWHLEITLYTRAQISCVKYTNK